MPAQLAKAMILNTGTGERVPVMYNPEEYRVEQRNEIAEIGVPGLAVSPVQYVRGKARVLSMDLFFDTYERATDVRAHTQRVVSLLNPAPGGFAPPVLLFVMGRFAMQCVLAEADQHFTMFLPDGTPVRARMSVRFTEYVRVELKVVSGLFVGPPTLHNVAERDTLANLAATYLGDPARWREIAEANDLDDPLRLTPGTRLAIPGRSTA
jgi:nucleoid-associated protein YgaU